MPQQDAKDQALDILRKAIDKALETGEGTETDQGICLVPGRKKPSNSENLEFYVIATRDGRDARYFSVSFDAQVAPEYQVRDAIVEHINNRLEHFLGFQIEPYYSGA